jgi:YfiH family protein
MPQEGLVYGAPFGPSVVAGFTTRRGGVSRPPYDSLNLALTVGDDDADVLANQRTMADELGVPVTRLQWAEQVHGADVAVVDESAHGTPEGARAVDALVTRARGVVLCIRVADCVPVLLADLDTGVVAAAHAGRVGLAAGVLENTVSRMEAHGARRDQLVVHIGPAVCGSCYEVPAEMADDVAGKVPGARAVSARGTPSLDLKAGARDHLGDIGVQRIFVSGECTLEHPQRWFSYRRDGVTGRFAGFIGLR